MRFAATLLKRTFTGFYEVRAPTMASSIAYFSLATIAPLGVVALWIGGLLLGPRAASGGVGAALSSVLGRKLGAEMLRLVGSESQKSAGQIAGIVSILLLIYGAGSLFLALQHALDVMWRVRIAQRTDLARHVALRAAVVFTAMFLPAVVLVVSTLARNIFVTLVNVPKGPPSPVLVTAGWQLLVMIGIFVVVAALLATLPDAKMPWLPIAVGAGFITVAWSLGTWLFGLYLSNVALASRFGAAGSLVALLIWVFLMAQLFLAGARLSYEYACLTGTVVTPRPWAEEYEKETSSPPGVSSQSAQTGRNHD